MEMDNPSMEDTVSQSMATLTVSWKLTLKIWWSISWRFSLLSILIGMFVGFTGGLVTALQGNSLVPPEVPIWISSLLSVPASIWVLHIILQKKFNGFAIALVPIEEVVGDQALADR